ncbi:MAG: hypothetical protein AAGJ29_13330 [Pseudomonadota bacterium]
MTFGSSTAALLLPVLLLAAPATAKPATISYPVDFSYDADAPAEEIYAAFQRTARAACRIDAPDVLTFAARREERRCAAQLLDDAVRATELAPLIALHEWETGPSPQHHRFAKRQRAQD